MMIIAIADNNGSAIFPENVFRPGNLLPESSFYLTFDILG